MDAEIEMIVKNQTWSWLTNQQINKFIGVKWGFKTKLNLDDTIQKHKARLVTKGYSQKLGVDYNETFVLVEKLDTIKNFIALATQKS